LGILVSLLHLEHSVLRAAMVRLGNRSKQEVQL